MDLQHSHIVGFFSLPSQAMQSANPTAYNTAISELRKTGVQLGSCAHCGMGIIHHVVVKDSAGKVHGIGTSCAEKIGLSKEAIREARNDYTYDTTPEQRAEWKAAKIKREAAQAEYDRLMLAARTKRLKARRKVVAEVYAQLMLIGSNFSESLADQLWSGHSLSYRQAECVCKMLSTTGRRNKKNAAQWDAQLDLCTTK